MSMNKQRVTLGIILCFIVVSILVPYTAELPTDNIERTTYSDIAWSENEIVIFGNEDLEDSGLPGNGTTENPFVIANLTIDSYHDNIDIQQTDYHILITNCTITGDFENGVGILLHNTSNVVISNCTISSKLLGIQTRYSENIQIVDCLFESVREICLSFDQSSNISVRQSTFLSIGELYEMWFTGAEDQLVKTGHLSIINYCTNITVENSIGVDLDNTSGGFYLYGCHKIALRNNTISEVDWGLEIQHCTDVTLANNVFGNTQVYLDGNFQSTFSQVSSNTIGEKELGIFINSINHEIDGNSLTCALLIGCSNISIRGGVFDKVNPPIGFWDCTNCTIQEATSNNNARIADSQNCSLVSITSTGSITLVNSEGSTIMDSSFLNTTDSAINLENSTLTYCKNNTIYNCRGGILVQYSDYTEITDNWIELSGSSGIQIGASRHGIITGNVILGSTTYGILLEGGVGRFDIYDNILGWNRVANALDDGSSNFWDDEISRGNNYSDYHGAAVYTISGDAGSVDNYPSGITEGFWFPPWRNAETEQQIMIIMIVGIFGAAVVVSGYIWKKYFVISKPLE